MEKKLQRDEHNKMVAGVCAGLAEYLNMDITLVRVLFVLAMILHGSGAGIYFILWIVMPKKVYGFNPNGPASTNVPFNNAGPVDYTVPPQAGNPVDYSVPNPFGTTPPPQPGAPFVMPPKKSSNASIIIGVALVAFGSFFLLDNFDFLPDWDFERLWPLIFVAMGIVLVFSRRKKQPWEHEGWNAKDEPAAETKEEPTTDTHTTDDNTPTV